MDYQKIYESLIRKRTIEQPITKEVCYCERHHIIPKSEGGSNNNDNLVYLTAREHYIAHLLLAKIYDDYKMWNAVSCFRLESEGKERRFRMNSRLFEKARLEAAEKGSGSGNSMWGRHHTEETKAKMRAFATGRHPSEQTLLKMSQKQKGRVSPMKGRHHTEATKQKLREANIGRQPSPETIQKVVRALSKKVAQYDRQGNLLRVFDSQTEAAKFLSVSHVAINLCCRGRICTCKGYVFRDYTEGSNNG